MEEKPIGGPALLAPNKISLCPTWSCRRGLRTWQEQATFLPPGAAGVVPPAAVLCCTAHPLCAPQKQPRATGTSAPFGHLGAAEKLGFTPLYCKASPGWSSWDTEGMGRGQCCR